MQIEQTADKAKEWTELAIEYGIEYGTKIIMAIIIWIIGKWIINIIMKLFKKMLKKNKNMDETLEKFLSNLVRSILLVLLIIAILGQLGIDTASFAAILAAAGLAVGLALQGSLSNFAGGVLIMLFRPFKVGDLIEAQGEVGVVSEIQIFTTKLATPGNKLAIIPNGALSNGNIKNYTELGQLRVDLTIGVSYDADIKETKEALMRAMTSQEKVLKDPAPTVNMGELADSSVNYEVRPWATPANYWDVYFQTIENCKIELDKAGIEIPYPHGVEIQKQA
ncbi:mechanosensitive ion channel domain-containing protein [uncultured Dokdonia sp.]|uniref:mechanosensitive ion channel family protein n=1 Tax=uncultured Dokdonia sp. TaxID=575653 RepID=UPI002613281D|nr:mechanosensitive ion channel domain-containing protein [uncultured Dokdonia sp.]